MRTHHRQRLQALQALTGYVWDLGQLDTAVLRALQAGVRAGIVVKERVLWPWVTFGIRTKTRYRFIGSSFEGD